VGAGIGESCIFPNNYKEALLSTTGLARFRIGKTILPEYLCAFLNSSGLKLKGLSQNTAQPFLNMGDIKRFLVPLPPLAEQERIVAKLEKLMKFCDELEANIRQGITNADQLLQTALKEALEPKENQSGESYSA